MNYRELPEDKTALPKISNHEAAKRQSDVKENKLS
jgi:hypothetical protein